MRAIVEPSIIQFDDGPLGARFCIWTLPASTKPRAIIVYVHPFAEEMNKARRMASLQARSLAGAGCAVLQLDLLGCGDSAGDFGDATWDAWVDDTVAACELARNRAQQQWSDGAGLPLWLWGLRAGCLLAAQAAKRAALPADFIFWQPALAGKQVLQQFLRLDIVAQRLGKPSTHAVVSARDLLASGQSAQVAGYAIHPLLARGLEGARLEPPGTAAKVAWFDAAVRPGNDPPPAMMQAQSSWQAAGHQIQLQPLVGPQFWQTVEIEDAPALVEATTAAVSSQMSIAPNAPHELH